MLYSIITLDVPDLSLWGGVGVIVTWDGVGSGIVVTACVGTGVGVVVGGMMHSRPAASKRVISAVEGLSVNNNLLRMYYTYTLMCINFDGSWLRNECALGCEYSQLSVATTNQWILPAELATRVFNYVNEFMLIIAL